VGGLFVPPRRGARGQGRSRAAQPNRYADAHMRSFPRERLWREPEAA
jgi:hypothetical protein